MTHGQLARQGQSIGFTSIYFCLCEKWKIHIYSFYGD